MQNPSAFDVPPNFLVQLMEQQTLKFKLGTCSLVCSTWAAAVADATTSITPPADGWKQQHFDSLTKWLEKHASPTTLNQLVLKRNNPQDEHDADIRCLSQAQAVPAQLQARSSHCSTCVGCAH
jgi:hypothetical protein